MGADDPTPLTRDMYQTGKGVDAVIEDQQLVNCAILKLAAEVKRPPCVGIDFSIYFSARIHAMPVNRLYHLARSLCRELPVDCRVRSELVKMLSLEEQSLPDPSVEDAAEQTICDIISEMFMPFVEGGIACLLVCDPGRGPGEGRLGMAAQGAYYISPPASCFLVLYHLFGNVCCCVAARLAQG
jgi:hypothetical protein